MKPPYSWR
ncbi:hypothetical protein VCCP1035_1691A, partial [Vibrio cholerae CP1035(8)]